MFVQDEPRGQAANVGGVPSCVITVKVVPGSSRDAIVGVLGDRLKMKVSAPPEAGKANRAVRELIARALGVPKSHVEVIAGVSNADKTIRVRGVRAAAARAVLLRDGE